MPTLGRKWARARWSEDIKSALARYCSKGIDVYCDNVGCTILDAVLEKINLRARIASCGIKAWRRAAFRPPNR